MGSGFIGGLLGVGGGIIIVPVLFLLLSESSRYPEDLVLLVAIATSLACIVFTSASAAYAQIKGRRVLWDIVKRLLPTVLLGSVLAGYLAPMVPSVWLRTGFAIFITAVAAVMYFDWKPSPHRKLPDGIRAAPIGFSAGLVSGLVGIAGGNVIVPTLVFFNVTAHQATATASTLGVPIAASGALSYMLLAPAPNHEALLGYVDLQAFFFIVIGSVLAAPVGVKFAQRLPAATLKKVFSVMLMLVAVRMVL